jgi:hypothetical protein
MKLDHFPRTCPNAFPAVCTSFLYNRNARFHQLYGIFRTNADTAAAVIALTRYYVNHQWSFSRHTYLSSILGSMCSKLSEQLV